MKTFNFYSFICILTFFFQIEVGKCKSILAVFPHLGKSHFPMYETYVNKLAERGHKVTLVTWLNVTSSHDNVKVISFGDESESINVNLAEYEGSPKFALTVFELNLLNAYGQKACAKGLSHPEVKALINSKKHFDLVVVEYFNTDCFAVFSHLFNAPLVGIFSSAPLPWHNDRMGNPDNPAYIPNLFSGHRSEMDFFSRLKNTFQLLFNKVYYQWFFSSPTDKIIKAHMGKGIPKVKDLVLKTSLYLSNSHFSLFEPRPLVPGMVEVGGLHINDPKKLPSDLERYLTNSKDGLVYFSLGTVAKGSTIPLKKRNVFLKAFNNITQNVLWKWESDDMAEKPKNVLLKKWVPQNDLLANPNVKVFITHGGLMGVLEAVSHGVPMILIPLFGDQFRNAAAVEEKGSGIVLDYFTLTEAKLSDALKKVLHDKRYTENAKLLSARFKERPLSPVNSAMYWTEYVLKFRGAPHLRPANTKLSWFSECLLDVFIFVVAAACMAVHFGKKAFLKYREMKAQESQKKKKK